MTIAVLIVGGLAFVLLVAAGLWRLARRRRLAAFRRAWVPPRRDPPNGGRRRKVLIVSTTPMRADGVEYRIAALRSFGRPVSDAEVAAIRARARR